ncbi:MAG: YqzG/YhdC family protein [Bacillus sp. (in: Bacteria)]|nr:YqzG/YhdC family protein [Bacillus sp. (in: firmicutes)]
MKKYLITILILFLISINFNNLGLAQKPDYEKYSRIAIAVVQADFPGEPIKDYEYLGRKKINETKVEDSFRFKVQENNKNLLVTVKVNHDITNKKLLNLTVESQVS